MKIDLYMYKNDDDSFKYKINDKDNYYICHNHGDNSNIMVIP